jgi:hypothetical protein
MIGNLFTFWLVGLAVVLVLKKNSNRPAWIDNIYDVIYLPVFNILKSLRNKFFTGNGGTEPPHLNPTLSMPNNSAPLMETVVLQFQLKDGQWATEALIAGPQNAQVITQALDALLRQKAGAANYAGRVRALGSISGQIYEIR